MGCVTNAPSYTITPTNTPAVSKTLTPSPTAKLEETPTTQQLTLTPTPGANISFLFFANGSVQKYNLLNWSSEKIPVQSKGDILQAVLSPNQKWLVFQDNNGINIVEYPFTGQVLTVSNIQSEVYNFVFSSNSELLSFSDGEGLKIFDISKKTSFLLITHMLIENDASEYRKFVPDQWSPDNKWLWVNVYHWEGISHILVHVPTKTFHEYTGCYSDIDWLGTSQAFIATVRYSGYLCCGDDDGIYLIKLNHKQIVEKRLYQETIPSQKWEREPRDIEVSPSEKEATFVQLSYPDTDLQSSRLMLINLTGDIYEEIDSSQDDITSPIWSSDGTKLFYTIQGNTESQVISLNLNSHERIVLNSLSSRAVLISRLPNSKWLIIGTNLDTHWDNLYLINSSTGELVKISPLDYDYYISPFLGLWPFEQS